jgi:DeoR/GlpR family transcriptional regulator of sugar metabolism
MRQRNCSTKVVARRAKLVQLVDKNPCAKVQELADSLNTSKRTVERDLAYLNAHDCLTIRRKEYFPFEPTETPQDLAERFHEAHSKTHSCEWCEELARVEQRQKQLPSANKR